MVTRRNILKSLLVSPLLPTSPGCAAPGQDRIVIIGAGVAGLAAAAILRQAGHDPLVLEARGRIGGRIHTSRIWPDVPVDLGASWIHGIKGNPVTDLARQAGAAFVTTSYDSARLHIDPGLAARGIGDAGTGQSEAILDRARRWAERQDRDVSVQAAVDAVVPTKFRDPGRMAQLDFLLASTLEQEYSGSTRQLSAWSYDDNLDFEGDDALFLQGYDWLPRYLARGLDVRLGQRVIQVSSIGGNYSITLADGSRIAASQVLVTVPLGVLKAGAIAFDPPLPAQKIRAIERLGMGLLNKHWLRFDKIFWPPEFDWHEYLSERKGLWSEWVSLAKHGATPVLMAFSAAEGAEALERAKQADVVASAMQALRAMFGSSIPDPVAAQITRWRADSHALGSYSFNAVGSNNADRKALAASDSGGLHFAGEANNHHYPGTVHGALISGRDAAQSIIRKLVRNG